MIDNNTESRKNWLFLSVSFVAAFALLLDVKHGVRRDGYLEPGWTTAIYFVLPMVSAVMVDAKRRLRTTLLSLLAATVVLIPIIHRAWIDGGKRFYYHNPEHMIFPALAGVLVILATAKSANVKLAPWGVSIGDWRWWGPKVGILLLAMVPFIGIAAYISPELREFYPEFRPARESAAALFKYQIGNGVYMFGWEFFFRGFLLFGVARFAGIRGAILLQAIPFMLLHKGKPEIEMMSSFFGAIGLGWFCWRAKSFWPAFLLHWAINIYMEIVGFIW